MNMEHLPTAETDLRYNLFDELAETAVTFDGETKTLGEWAKECPFDLDDPNVTDDMKSDYTVKFANAAGVKIDKKYEKQFAETLEKHGIEQNFKVAPEAAEHKGVPAKEAITKSPRENTKLSSDTSKAPAAAKIEPKIPELAERLAVVQNLPIETMPKPDTDVSAKLVAQTAIAEVIDFEILHGALENETARQIPDEILVSDTAVNAVQLPEPLQREVFVMDVPQLNSESLGLVVNADRVEITDIDTEIGGTVPSEQLAGSYELIETVDLHKPADIDNALAEPMVRARETIETISQEMAINILADELQKEPADIFDDFVAAGEYYMQVISDDLELTERADAASKEQQTSSPLRTIIERMQSVDESMKIQAAETVQQLIGVIHGLAILESRTDTPVELTEQIAAQIVAIYETLLTQLDLELSEDDMQSLANLFQQPEFLAGFIVQEIEQAIDTGMHEALDDNSASISSYLSGIHPSRILSRFILALPIAT